MIPPEKSWVGQMYLPKVLWLGESSNQNAGILPPESMQFFEFRAFSQGRRPEKSQNFLRSRPSDARSKLQLTFGRKRGRKQQNFDSTRFWFVERDVNEFGDVFGKNNVKIDSSTLVPFDARDKRQ